MNQAASASTESQLPPMLAEYLSYKERFPDHMVLFQVGDFFEVFFEDAQTVAKALNLTLTSRDKKQANPIPMCGVPIAVIDSYLDRLVDAGLSAALVVQAEESKPGKGMVKRKLERIVTPSVRITAGADSFAKRQGSTCAVVPESEDSFSLAVGQIDQAAVTIFERLSLAELSERLLEREVVELILPNRLENTSLDRRRSWVKEIENRALRKKPLRFRSEEYTRSLLHAEREGARRVELHPFSPGGRRAARLLINYFDEATVETVLPLQVSVPDSDDGVLLIDSMTRLNLDLIETGREGTEYGSLLGYLNHTCSPGGYRLLREWIIRPVRQKDVLEERYDAVASLTAAYSLRSELQGMLQELPDIERLVSRIEIGIVSPRELGALRDVGEKLPLIQGLLQRFHQQTPSNKISKITSRMKGREEAFTPLAILSSEPPVKVVDGEVFCSGIDETIDELRTLQSSGREWLRQFEEKEREATGISSLKVKSNSVLGFYIEVTKSNIKKVPAHYIRRQSMANAERFVTEALQEGERKIQEAESRLLEREKELFRELVEGTREHAETYRELHSLFSELDVLAGFAELVERDQLVRPVLTEGLELEVSKGCHPVLRSILQEKFIPNSISFGEQARCFILTGPNMGGKSTYLRQVGLLSVCAQIGCYLPCESAKIGLIDRLFARLGASDDLLEGDSTFMVEMREASHILARASERSLVLIDELGRGTSTTDGRAIAQAVLEWIAGTIGCRTLFATHFHSLTKVAARLPRVRNISVGMTEGRNGIIFPHTIEEGAASGSYGIEVARLSGVPPRLVNRAQEILLEGVESGPSETQLSFFAGVQRPAEPPKRDELRERIAELEPDNLSPREALALLYDLKSEASER